MTDKFVTWKDNRTGTYKYEIGILKKASVGESYVSFDFEDTAIGFAVDKKHFKGKFPKKGDVVEFYGLDEVLGLCINGKTIFFKGVLEHEAERKEWLGKHREEKLEKFKKDKPKFDKWFKELPEVFKRRIQLFRDNGKDWRVNCESYEIMVCREAINIASQCDTPKKVKEEQDNGGKNIKLLDNGHSGNSMSFSYVLAYWYKKDPEMVYKFHGAMTPLMGCEEYGCIHPR